jgi:hypothetical protein
MTYRDPHQVAKDATPFITRPPNSLLPIGSRSLRAKAISTEWCAYDAADFVRRVDEFDAANERLNCALIKRRRKIERARSLRTSCCGGRT